MAQLALGAAGAAIGFFAGGGPFGAQVGFVAGSMIGGAIDRSMQKPVEGPRLEDLRVTTSTYGQPIPQVQGTVRLKANMIWSTGLREHRKKTGGKGSTTTKGPGQVQYSYEASFAMSFCEGPIDKVLRIWLDKKLVFDATNSGEAIGVPGLVFRVYHGTEVQLPDPAIVAMLGADAPAHRGLCYVVFDSVPLANSGNRIPNCEVEVCATVVPALPYVDTTNLSSANGSPYTAPQNYSAVSAADWTRRIAVRGLQQGGGNHGIGVQNLETGVELRVKTTGDMCADGGFADPGTDTAIVAIIPGGTAFYSSSAVLGATPVRFDPVTLVATAVWEDTGGVGADSRRGRLPGCHNMAATKVITDSGARDLLLWSDYYAGVRIIDVQDFVSIWGMTTAESGEATILDGPSYPGIFTAGAVAHILGGEQRLGETDVWLLSAAGSGTTADRKPRMQRVRVASYAVFAPFAGQTMGLVAEDQIVLEPGVIHPGATIVSVHSVQYDPTDNCLVFATNQVSGIGAAWRLVKVDNGGALVWTTEIAASPSIPTGHARIDGTKIALVSTNPGVLIDLATGVSETFTNAYGGGTYVFDGYSRSVVMHGSSALQRRVWLDRAAGDPSSLADTVTWLCEKVGFDASDIDVSDLSGDVRGFMRGQETIRESITQLERAFLFDTTEQDGKLVFVPRGGNVVATVDYDLVLRRDGDQPAMPIRERDETELPRRVWCDFIDVEKDQQQNSMPWARAMAPTVLTASRQETHVDCRSIVMTPSEAKTIAMRHCLDAYASRFSIEGLGLTFQHIGLNAGDAVTQELPDGTLQRVRYTRVELGADYTLNVDAVFEDGTVPALTTTGDGGQGHVTQSVPAPVVSKLLLGNVPLLADTDDTGGVALRVYAGGAGYSSGTWLGARLFYSRDASLWDPVISLLTPMAWGECLTAMPDAPISPFLTDRSSTLRVVMHAGGDDIETVTELEMLNGSNRALLVTPDGQAELIGFRDVTANGDGSFTLSTFLRGQRGTEWACGLHSAGGLFVLVNDALEPITLALGDINQTRYARLVGRFDAFDAVPLEARTITGAAEKPYAPCSIAGSRDGSGSITITWLRRTRIGGEWLDGTEDVPLGEASESYEVDIMAGDEVVRTITSLTSASAPYSADDQTTDFGSPQAEIDVRVYQMSAAVGRGYAGSATV